MLKVINTITKEKNANLFFILEDKNNIEKLKKIGISENILKNLEKKFEEKKEEKSFFKEYFIGKKNIEKLFVCFFDEKNSKKSLEEFMGDSFRKTPEKLIILTENNIEKIVEIAFLSKYKFDYYLEKKQNLEIKILLNGQDKEKISEIEKKLEKILELIKNTFSSRDLVNLSTPEKTPEKIIKLIKSFELKNTKIKILDYKQIKKLGLNLLENVGKASENKPALVILERIVDEKAPIYGFVGKGIVFDTGGLNIKVGENMKNMKTDMAGASTVIHTMKELDEKDLKVNIIGAIALAENSISENAYRPDDIIKAYNGKTVEIINTDAEGRLVLADAMSYISKEYKLDSIITIATLTGACLHALGHNYAGIMGNNEEIMEKLLRNNSFEKYNKLPFDNYLIGKTKGKISDLKNLSTGTFAGASMGAAFLSNFCDKNENFVHIDIAGTSDRKDNFGVFPAGATGFGVKSMSNLFLEL